MVLQIRGRMEWIEVEIEVASAGSGSWVAYFARRIPSLIAVPMGSALPVRRVNSLGASAGGYNKVSSCAFQRILKLRCWAYKQDF